ncbi:MAG: hypothetical protein ACK5HL_01030 [Bacilli bacterium]
MYTINTNQSLNCLFRNDTKIKTVFSSNQALIKYLDLITQNITKKRTERYGNWDQVLGKCSIIFERRV